MKGKHNPNQAPNGEENQMDRERHAHQQLLAAGAHAIDARPWRPAPIPISDVDFVHFAMWKSAELGDEELLSALALMPAARAEIDAVEAGLLFVARSAGLTWTQIADAMGFRSRQACQQHYERLAAKGTDKP
ncbi:hypothetical protein [Rhodococcus sovatensis]|uniref:DNA-binding protein n=1 Tax=Rhodococcus sovatensis TaxID=1805840 RepID=A0ABZ2PHI4_9NOCA